ncbi:hypothetical protein NOS3756_45150 [Nostoc sp. NIES-3756]|uniref:glycosyltransferase 87 family protein n=1 Tax=Nostoc sp. NIES-3756 TaxID=1751286 RepID=UPI00071F4921|nr:glycosyltransferase 87 family protein [Nostoc sp. NIES-3756]BAT55527.1 hypothetical protein NOS3756_45150 [Nostoc sp. NIES-3756]
MNLSQHLFKSKNLILFACCTLTLLCLAYFLKGFYHLVIQPDMAKDLYSRWQEQQYIYRGLYPYNIRNNSPLVISEIGPIVSGGYPPWAFFTGFIIFPPISWELTRLYHGLLNLVCLFIEGIFAYQIGRPYGQLQAWFTTVSCLSISSHVTTLGVGQYGIIINAFLIGVFWLLETRQDIMAGLLLGLALAKPNISALYFFILIICKRNLSILSCCIYILIASLTIGFIVKLSPLYMLFNQIQVASYFAESGNSGINILIDMGINPLLAIILSGLLATLILIIIFYCIKNSSLIYLFAIASVIGRLGTYHLIYDNVMLFFLLLSLIKLNYDKQNRSSLIILGLVLLSLVIPAKVVDLSYLRNLQTIIWIGATIYILLVKKDINRALQSQ